MKQHVVKFKKWLAADNKRLRLGGGLLMLAGVVIVFQVNSARGAAYTWDGGGTDGTCGGGVGDGNKWSCAANWSSDIVPGAADTVTFNGTSTKNADITGAVSVLGMTIASGYSGTITQQSTNTLTVGTSGFSQADGTVTGGSGSITVNGTFTLSGGIFTSTSGTLSVNNTWTHTAGGTFNHNNGTVTWTGANSGRTWDVATTETFNNLTINVGGWIMTVASGDTLIVLGTYTQTDGGFNTGTIEARGNVSLGSSADTSSTGTLLFAVSGDQTITGNGGSTSDITVSKSSGTLDAGSTNLGMNSFTLTSGTFTSTSGTLTVRHTWTHTAGGTFNHNNGTVIWNGASSNRTWDVATTETFNNFTINVASWTMTMGTGDTFIVLGTFTHTDGIINVGTVEARGSLTVGTAADASTATISFPVAGDQTVTGAANAKTGHFNIAKPSGTVTLSSDLQVASFTMSSGTFNGGTGTITLPSNADFTLSGGTFTSTSGNLSVGGNFTHTAGGTFNHNNGTVTAAVPNTLTKTWDVATTETFNNLTVSASNGSNCILAVATGDTLVVLGTFAQTVGLVGGTGTIEVRGNMTAGNNVASTGTIAFLVSGDQTITQGGSGGGTSVLNINKPSGTVSFANGNNMTIGGLVLSSGTFTSTSGTLTVVGNWTRATGTTFNTNNGSVTTSAGGSVVFDVPETEMFNNLTITGTDFNRFTDISTGDTLVVTGTFTHTTTSMRGGTVEVRGPMVGGSSITGSNVSTTTILFNQAGNQTITASGGGTAFINIAKPSGTVTLSGNYTVRGFSQQSGAFNAGTGTFTNTANFTLTGGEFTSTTGTFSILGHWTHAAGTFSHNNGTVSIDPTGAATWNFDFPVSETFNNLTVNGQDLNRLIAIASGDRAIVTGTFTFNNGTLNGPGIIEAQGNVSIASGSDGGSAGLTFAGTANQNFDLPGAANFNGDVTVNKGGGKVTFTSGATFDATNQDFVITQGVVDLGTANNVTVMGTGGSLVVGTNGILQGFGTGGSLLLGVTLTNSGTVHLNGNGTTCGDADSIQIRSTVGGVQRAWNGTGKFIITDVDVRDIGGTAPIVATSSTLLTNMGANWTNNATCQHTVASPNGAESWAVRSSQTVSWSSYAGADHYRLFYSTNSGGSWTEIGTTASTSYNWTVPAAQTSTARVLVAAEDAGNTVLAQDMSDADFTFLTFGTILKGGIQFKGGVTF